MRLLISLLLLLFLLSPVRAQSVIDNVPAATAEDDGEGEIPPAPEKPAPAASVSADTYTVADVNADVTADTATHARDQALMQAERGALSQLLARLGQADIVAKLSDDTVAGYVQSFEVQSEHLSSVRYIGIFTIRFKPAAIQKKFADKSASPAADAPKMAAGPVSHLTVAVQTDSLAAWAQIRKRLAATPAVAHIETLDLGRGTSHIDLAYGGGAPDLQKALTDQGLVLRQTASGWILYDGSMVTR